MATEKKEEKKATKKETVKVEKVEQKTISGMDYKQEILLIYILPFVGLVFALMKDRKVSDMLRFHYNQSATTAIILIALGLINCIPYFNMIKVFISLLVGLVSLAIVIFNIITLVKVYKYDENYSIPLVSDLSKAIFK